MKKIHNPLTIIGLFAGIAEVAGTIVLPFVDINLQKIFIWYVMGFPIILVILFFITLNKNPRVLYAPSDFNDEKNFMALITQASNVLTDIMDKNPNIENELQTVEQFIEQIYLDTESYTIKINSDNVKMVTSRTCHSGCLVFKNQILELLKDEITIGKGVGVDLEFDSTMISRKHCMIKKTNEGYYLQDLASTNGTFINGKKIQIGMRQHLSNRDIIKVANITFTILI